MRKIVLVLLSLCCMACNDEIEVRRTIDSNLLIPKSGLQILPFAADQAEVTYKVVVYRSGYNEGTSKASLQVDEAALKRYNEKMESAYKLLPANYYTLPKEVVVLTNDSFMQGTQVVFTTEHIDSDDYVLPLTLKSEDGTPVMANSQTVLISLRHKSEEAPNK